MTDVVVIIVVLSEILNCSIPHISPPIEIPTSNVSSLFESGSADSDERAIRRPIEPRRDRDLRAPLRDRTSESVVRPPNRIEESDRSGDRRRCDLRPNVLRERNRHSSGAAGIRVTSPIPLEREEILAYVLRGDEILSVVRDQSSSVGEIPQRIDHDLLLRFLGSLPRRSLALAGPLGSGRLARPLRSVVDLPFRHRSR